MKKEAQEFISLINLIPVQAVPLLRSPLSNKEAQALYDIWQNERDEYDKPIIPDHIDPMLVAALTTKGCISNGSGHSIARSHAKRSAELTKKAKEIIKTIILHEPKSAFENAPKNINFDNIWHASHMMKLPKTSKKVASRVVMKDNWLIRAYR